LSSLRGRSKMAILFLRGRAGGVGQPYRDQQ
jgi:hypothetical protein